ncbi:MAG: hypothetical protein Q4D30_01340 [Bacteroidales bacterium]|nr:hypothetical protein [Bacteroidales bacterium]
MDVSQMLSNIADISLSFTRSDLSGVVRKFGGEFRLIGTAMEALVSHFVQNGTSSVAAMAVYPINDNWTYEKAWECQLDFGTFQYTLHDCSISAIDNSLAAAIKAHASTKYQYLVEDIKDPYPLYYDHLSMNSFAEYLFGGEMDEYGGTSVITFQRTGEVLSWPLFVTKSEVANRKMMLFSDSGQESGSYFSSGTEIFENLSDQALTVNVSLRITGSCENLPQDTSDSRETVSRLHMCVGIPGGSSRIEPVFTVYTLQLGTSFADEAEFPIYVGPREKVGLFTIGWKKDDTPVTVNVQTDSFIRFDLTTRNAADTCDIVRPQRLLQALVQSMTGRDDVTCTIDNPPTVLDQTHIVAAESARGVESAYLHTSYKDFCAMMSSVFGYVPVIGTDSVRFVKRDTLFVNSLRKQLSGKHADLSVSVDASMIYSKVVVGYENQEYDSVNGRDEWRFSTEYDTGVTMTDNELEMISPYRADAYGLEFLFMRRGEDTTDSGSDEDVFIVHAMYNGRFAQYRLNRHSTDSSVIDLAPSVSGVLDPDTMFNVVYSPRYMVAANNKYLASFTRRLAFASSGGNHDVVVGGMSVGDDIVIAVELGTSMFMPAHLNIKTSDIEIPEAWDGYVAVEAGGYRYEGYLDDVTFGFGKDKPASYDLVLKQITPTEV